MAILVIAEHDNAALKAATLSTVAAAREIGGEIHVLVAGHLCSVVAQAAARLGRPAAAWSRRGSSGRWHVHDSFNMFMHTSIQPNGEPYIAPQKAKKGDYLELLALIDVLAVPNVCGADVTATSEGYELDGV